MSTIAERNFVRQQGFVDATDGGCGVQYPALMWQPRVTGVLVVIGLWLQSWPIFLGLAAILWWNVAVPRLSIFDALYNRLVAGPKGLARLGPAPAPRRFAQALAGTFMVGIAISLLAGWSIAAWVLEAFLVVALGALLLGRFCLGSYLYLVATGRFDLARQTTPWSRPPMNG